MGDVLSATTPGFRISVFPGRLVANFLLNGAGVGGALNDRKALRRSRNAMLATVQSGATRRNKKEVAQGSRRRFVGVPTPIYRGVP